MKKILLGGLITIITLSLLSYTTTEGKGTYNGLERIVYNAPLKQKKVITTDDIIKVNKLVKQGYRVEFVTENFWNGSSGTETTYTLILY